MANAQRVSEGKSMIEEGFTTVLLGLNRAYGLDLEDKNLIDTPARVARSMLEMLQGIDTNKAEELLKMAFPSHYTGMVVLANIPVYSVCPHHFLPVKYSINFGYIPSGLVLGLSKIPRFIKLICQAPMLQETVTENIVDQFMTIVKPLGCMVTIKGYHMCMGCRGVEMPEVATLTSSIRGNFKELVIRDEFFNLVKAQEF